ncbi:hypothetical protein RMATCC62417_01697 [Rhizopus microsporus]|nr:hypothetical protein RMATCC62417_01697 [Rhizopus microsporus]
MFKKIHLLACFALAVSTALAATVEPDVYKYVGLNPADIANVTVNGSHWYDSVGGASGDIINLGSVSTADLTEEAGYQLVYSGNNIDQGEYRVVNTEVATVNKILGHERICCNLYICGHKVISLCLE